MKVTAQTLQEIAKVLGTVKAEQFLFAGQLAHAIGQNISVNVLCPDIGTFGVSAEKFSQIAGRLDGELDITLINGLGKVEVNDPLITKIAIKGKGHKFTLPVVASPVIPKVALPLTAVAVLPLKEFNTLINYAASASDEGNAGQFSYTGSIQISSTSGQIVAAGTDGRRLALISEANPAPPFSFIMPVQVIQVVKGLRDAVISVYQDNQNLYFRCGGVTIIARQLAKSFPGYESSIPKAFNIRSKVAAQDMKDALRRVSPLVDETQRITLTISDTNVTINVSNQSGTADDEIAAQSIESDPLFDSFSFIANFNYLQDYFDEVTGDVIISGTESGKPIFLEAGARKLLCASQKT